MNQFRALSTLAFLALSPLAYSQDNLADIREMGPGATVTATGIVTNGGELGTIRYIQDETAGLAIYDLDATEFARGDEVTVIGILEEFNQLLEVVNLTGWTVNSSMNPLPLPKLVTVASFGEVLEGQLIRVNQVTFTDGGGIFAGNTNYDISSAGGNGQVRISGNSSLTGQFIPSGQVDLIGILGQYHLNDPDLGYQLLLRDLDDIIPEAPISVTTSLALSDLTPAGFRLSWKTNIGGSTQLFYGHTPALELGVLSGEGGDTLHTVAIDGAEPSTVFYARGFSVREGDTAYTGTQVFITSSLSAGEMKVYFTSAVDHSVSSGTDAVQIDDAADDTLIAWINRASESIDAAIYNFGTSGISDIASALNNAYNRGVRLRIIYNSNTSNVGIDALAPDIPRLASPAGGEEIGIMHNKFVIFDAFSPDHDDAVVWTGSTNWTSANINTDANNIIIIRDKSLAIGFTLEFNEMWGGPGETPNEALARFGAAKTDNTPHEYLIGGKPVYCYFSPSDGVNSRIIEAVNSGDADIEVNTMLITRADIGYALADRAVAGVTTRVIVNAGGDCTETVVNTLKDAIGFNFREYGEDGLLHSKCMIVDPSDPGSDPLVLAGSHNWSNNAETRNDENTLVIHDAVIANIFYQEFIGRFNKGIPLNLTEPAPPVEAMSIRPNPSGGCFWFTAPGLEGKSPALRILDMDGRQLWHQNVTCNESGAYVCANVPAGIFIVEISDGSKLLRHKVVISR